MPSGWNKKPTLRPPNPPAAPPYVNTAREKAISLVTARPDELRLQFGELSAEEIRLIKAVALFIAN
jgi:hypothetical protein